jgi:hypothetical protein
VSLPNFAQGPQKPCGGGGDSRHQSASSHFAHLLFIRKRSFSNRFQHWKPKFKNVNCESNRFHLYRVSEVDALAFMSLCLDFAESRSFGTES